MWFVNLKEEVLSIEVLRRDFFGGVGVTLILREAIHFIVTIKNFTHCIKPTKNFMMKQIFK